ncbi:MAG: sigma-70 family RNA polymerase sigma factor [Candidatus Rokubacteria bacterium]|nr:sigma-70 family RNA polymerase sigma factor [Candidatus Rokubacteria bacterium]
MAAFEPLVEKYRQRVWRLAYQVLRDREEAWDCAQEAFVRAFQSLPAFRGQSAFYTWLFRITLNLATDRHRARGARARAFGAERMPEEEWARTAPDSGATPEQAAIGAEKRERIRAALNALPLKFRTIIMLSDVEGLSYREIAQVLNCPIGTVMSRLHNARRRLRAILGPMLGAVLWLAVTLLAPAPPAQAEQMIRFGVRVLQASSPAPAPPPTAAPGQRHLAPPSAAPAPPAAPPEAETDERLRRILPRLRTLFRYTEYTTLDRQRAEVALGTQQRFHLPGARQLEVTPDQLHGQSVRMRVRLLRGEQPELRTNIVAAPGAPAVLGGPTYGDGVLIIILWANPNPSDR